MIYIEIYIYDINPIDLFFYTVTEGAISLFDPSAQCHRRKFFSKREHILINNQEIHLTDVVWPAVDDLVMRSE